MAGPETMSPDSFEEISGEALGSTRAEDTVSDSGGPGILAAESLPEEMIGTVLDGRWRLDAVMGGGAMGVVYRAARLERGGRPVAVKVLRPDPTGRSTRARRFRREVSTIGRLRHPHIVAFVDAGVMEGGRIFLVTELLEGEPLSRLIRREAPLGPPRTMRIAGQILQALVAAHGRGVVHRDLKPDNIFVTRERGEPDFVKVLDFGVAKVRDGESPEGLELTRHGETVGSPRYMAPEQAMARTVLPQSDLYGVGLVMYEMLTGRPPFEGRDAREMMRAHAFEPPPPPSIDGDRLSGPLVELVMRLLEKDPADRPRDAADALTTLWWCATCPDPVTVRARSPRAVGAEVTADLPARPPRRRRERTPDGEPAADRSPGPDPELARAPRWRRAVPPVWLWWAASAAVGAAAGIWLALNFLPAS